VRRILSVVLAIAVALLGAKIVGEYEFRGYVPFVAGPLFGLVVAEIAVSVAGRRDILESAVAALATAAGLAWGTWLSTSEGVEPWPVLGWAAIALGIVVAGARTGQWGWIRRPAGAAPSRPTPDPPRTPMS